MTEASLSHNRPVVLVSEQATDIDPKAHHQEVLSDVPSGASVLKSELNDADVPNCVHHGESSSLIKELPLHGLKVTHPRCV